MNKKVLAVLGGIVVAAVVFALVFRPFQKEGVIKIGAVLPLSGKLAPFGKIQQRALLLAQERINSEGGINGNKLEFIFEDSKGEATIGVSAVRKLIDLDRTKVLFVFKSTIIGAVQPITDKASVLLMAFAMDPQIAERSRLTFRVYPNLRQQTEVMLQYLSTLKPGRMAIIYIQTPATEYILPKLLVPGIKDRGWKLTSTVSFTKKDRDLKTHIAKLKRSNPDAILTLAHFVFIPTIIKNLQEQGLLKNVRILGYMDYTFPLKVPPQLLEGITFVSPRYSLEVGGSRKRSWFENEYKEKYGEFPGYDPVFFYDAAMIIAEATKKEGYSVKGIQRYLKGLKAYPGVSGSITIDEFGDAIVKLEMGIFRGGNRKALY